MSNAASFPNGRWLLCRPIDYDVRYKINPWMDTTIVPDTVRAAKQWQLLHHTLLRLGAWVEYIEQGTNVPDMVFTANGGLVCGGDVVIPKFRHAERQPEEALFKTWFLERGYNAIELTSGAFEGEGDALFIGNILVGGYGFRTDEQIYDELKAKLTVSEIIKIHLVDPRFYHLDTCFCPLEGKTVLAFPDAFDAESKKTLAERFEVIAVPADDAARFVCNSVVLGKEVIMPAGCKETTAILEARGFNVHPVPLDEFIKAGGAAKCLSLKIG